MVETHYLYKNEIKRNHITKCDNVWFDTHMIFLDAIQRWNDIYNSSKWEQFINYRNEQKKGWVDNNTLNFTKEYGIQTQERILSLPTNIKMEQYVSILNWLNKADRSHNELELKARGIKLYKSYGRKNQHHLDICDRVNQDHDINVKSTARYSPKIASLTDTGRERLYFLQRLMNRDKEGDKKEVRSYEM